MTVSHVIVILIVNRLLRAILTFLNPLLHLYKYQCTFHQYSVQLVQQCIQISTRINSSNCTYVHTCLFHSRQPTPIIQIFNNMGGGDCYPSVQKSQSLCSGCYLGVGVMGGTPPQVVPLNCMKCVFQYMYPRSVLEASTVSTASTAYREGPVTSYINALNAVDAVEPSNIDLGYIYWKTHFIQLGGLGGI